MEFEQQSLLYNENRSNSIFNSIFINYVNEQSNQTQDYSNIYKITTINENNTAKTFFNTLDEGFKAMLTRLPYPEGDEIPEIKIRDEDFLVSGEEIKLYDKYDNDYKFNKCKICGENENSYFCSNCNSNLCQKCFDSFDNKCKREKHKWIDLKKVKVDIENIKQEIIKIFQRYNVAQNNLKKIQI